MTYGHGGPTDPFGRDPFTGDASFAATAFGAAPAPAASPREVNTLATLSVVFAFVFAPAGALLGHLGLAQLGRTGQRGRDRALVGLTLSYLFITVAVVSVVVWMAIGTPSTPPNIASPPPTSTQPSAAPATTTSPPSAGAPTLTAIAPPGPLLNLDEMKAILGTPANKYAPAPLPVPDLAAYPSFDTVDTTLQTQGRISDADCAAMVFAGTAVAFQGVDMQAIQQVTMAQPGPQGTQSVTETAVSFASPADANAALTHYLAVLDPCKGRTVTLTTAPQGAVYQLELTTGVQQNTFTDPDGQQVYMFEGEQQRDPLYPQKSDELFGVERGFLVRGNMLIDVSVRGFRLFADHQEVLAEIAKKVP
jgi:eukaryotic-like serine/threonine-protein kinase